MISPNRTLLAQALGILEDQNFVGWVKQGIKERLFELDLVSTEPAEINEQVLQARVEAQKLDNFMNQLREYINEA